MTDRQGVDKKIKVAVVTGSHSYNVIGFHQFFRGLDGIDPYVQHIGAFCSSPEEVRDSYDVALFYIMMPKAPSDEGPWYDGKQRRSLRHLGETKQGIFVMHHAVLAYLEWTPWDEIVGIPERKLTSFHIGETVKIEIANPEHPITKGLSAWEMIDETYVMNDAKGDNEILLTTGHPKSMKTIGWTKQYRNSRVFCLESGHDDRTWKDANFRTIVERGIKWASGRS